MSIVNILKIVCRPLLPRDGLFKLQRSRIIICFRLFFRDIDRLSLIPKHWKEKTGRHKLFSVRGIAARMAANGTRIPCPHQPETYFVSRSRQSCCNPAIMGLLAWLFRLEIKHCAVHWCPLVGWCATLRFKKNLMILKQR